MSDKLSFGKLIGGKNRSNYFYELKIHHVDIGNIIHANFEDTFESWTMNEFYEFVDNYIKLKLENFKKEFMSTELKSMIFKALKEHKALELIRSQIAMIPDGSIGPKYTKHDHIWSKIDDGSYKLCKVCGATLRIDGYLEKQEYCPKCENPITELNSNIMPSKDRSLNVVCCGNCNFYFIEKKKEESE